MRVGEAFVVDSSLVVYRSRWVVVFYPTVASFEVSAHTGFVAHTPYYYRYVVAVALDHALVALKVSLGVAIDTSKSLFVVAHAMRLDVGFVYHIQAIFVAKVVPLGCVGVVACAHSVDIEFLHQCDVFYHALTRHYKALPGIYFMTIYAFNEYWFAVDKQLSVLNL